MLKTSWLRNASPAFRLLVATSWLAPDPCRENQETAIGEACAARPDWDEYLFLVDRHRVPALSWAALRRVQGTGIPEPAKQELQKRSDACRIKAMQHCSLLANLLKQLNLAGIPAMPLKGPILSSELYADVGLRHSLDLDLEVTAEDLARTQTVLETAGWRLDSGFSPMTPRQWGSFLRYEHEMVFRHSLTGSTLELQWRNSWENPDDTRARWARTIPSAWQGCSIQAMNSGDKTLYLCGHGGHHAWFRAKWLGDLARAHASGVLDWEAAWKEARRSKQERILQVGLYLLDHLYGLPLPNLPGCVSISPASPLVSIPLRALRDSRAPRFRTDPASLLYRLRISRYEQMLWPRRTWRERWAELFHNREDFRLLPLPDSLFWAYKPLRPFLWFWRWALQTRRHPEESKD